MANNAFSRIAKSSKGGMTVDAATVTFSAAGTATKGLLVQNVQIQYQQQINFIYDLTDNTRVFYIAGRAEGNLQIGKVVSNTSTYQAFLEKFANVCTPNTSLTIKGTQGCASNTSTTTTGSTGDIKVNNPIVTSYGITLNINDGIVAEQVQMKFPEMEL